MKASSFTHELAKTSAVFGRKSDVRVVFTGDGAATDGNIIKLPSLDHNADVSEEQAAIMRGYVDHEAGHVRHTDFTVLRKHKDELAKNKLLHSCANALEDIWLEQRVRAEYPGASDNIKATADAVNREFLDNVKADDERLRDPVWVGPVAATWIGRTEYVPETTKQCIDMLDDELREQITDIVRRVDGCRNSHEIFDLAREFEGAMRKGREDREIDKPETPEGAPSEERGDGSMGESDEFEETTTHEDEQDGSTSEAGDTDGDVDDGSRGSDASDKDGTDKPEGSPDADRVSDGEKLHDDGNVSPPEHDVDDVYEDFDLKKAIDHMMEKSTLKGDGGSATYRPWSTEHDKWHHRTDEPNKYGRKSYNNFGHHILAQGAASDYEHRLTRIAGTSNSIRRKLERALLAKETRDWDTGREAGRLDTKRLVSAVAGRVNVFKTRTDRAELDTAVTILVDLSGSMGGYPAEIATDVAICISEALERTSINYEVLGFENMTEVVGSDDAWREMICEGYEKWSRVEPIDMIVFKKFDERLVQARGAIATMEKLARGNNTDGECVELAYKRLVDRPEKRKVMMVLSDGYPEAAGDRVQQNRHLKNVTKMIEGSDVDLVGIGICSNAVETFYSKHVVVKKLDDLAGTVMDQLAQLLMGDRFVVDNTKLHHAV